MHITAAFAVSAAGLLLMGATASSAPALAFVALLASTASMATDTLNVSELGHLSCGQRLCCTFLLTAA